MITEEPQLVQEMRRLPVQLGTVTVHYSPHEIAGKVHDDGSITYIVMDDFDKATKLEATPEEVTALRASLPKPLASDADAATVLRALVATFA